MALDFFNFRDKDTAMALFNRHGLNWYSNGLGSIVFYYEYEEDEYEAMDILDRNGIPYIRC